MQEDLFQGLQAGLSSISAVRAVGRVAGVDGTVIWITGLSRVAAMGDRVQVLRHGGGATRAEVIRISDSQVAALPDNGVEGLSLGDRVAMLGPTQLRPGQAWIGRIIDPYGRPLDGHPLHTGPRVMPARAAPPPAAERQALGAPLATGLNVLDTMLPIVRGQRIGLFAGSGVGKSRLLAHLARRMVSDVVVLALVGERGRELRDFVEKSLGPAGMARSVVVAATSDKSPQERRRCLLTAMTVAEYFRDQGQDVLFLADSVTRFAEAHREVALAAGELPALRGFPASVSHQIMALSERAGPGCQGAGQITAVFSVLVAGSDMEEPVADMMRGVLDGHVVLDRQIAERGRYPAIDVLRSVSRSLPDALTDRENALIRAARAAMSVYAASETMIRAGLYRRGHDPQLDQAVLLQPELEGFLAGYTSGNRTQTFDKLALLLRRAGIQTVQPGTAGEAQNAATS